MAMVVIVGMMVLMSMRMFMLDGVVLVWMCMIVLVRMLMVVSVFFFHVLLPYRGDFSSPCGARMSAIKGRKGRPLDTHRAALIGILIWQIQRVLIWNQ